MRRLVLLVVALVALGAPVVRADQVSRSREAFYGDQAQACRFLLGRNDPRCNVDGYDLSERNVAEYEASWTHRAIALQRQLDLHAPLRDELFPHTHNSFNSEAYTPSLSRLDHNQLLSITDQLRLDMRAIEIDVHRAPSVTEGGRVGVVACHAEPVGPVHAGCTNEEPLSFYLTELRGWLDANPTEMVLLYLENNLDDDPAAHDEAAGNIRDLLGDRVYRPPADQPCAEMPYDLSRADILATAQVLIVGNCGAGGAWGTWVHERGSRWDESSDPAGATYDCDADRTDAAARTHDYESNITRRYEDRTWLTAMAGGEGGITETEMAAMVACGVNLAGFDMLHPDDPRLDDLVWSWAVGEPAASGCALQVSGGRWVSRPCTEKHRVACYADGQWTVSAKAVRWDHADRQCAFAAPWNGRENALLLAAGHGDVWVRSQVEVAP